MKFSERMGFVKVSDVFQTDSMSQELRNRIYNFIVGALVKYKAQEHIFYYLHCKFYKLPLHGFEYNTNTNHGSVDRSILSSKRYKIYDLLEHLLSKYNIDAFVSYMNYTKEEFITNINQILEEERSGYRIIDGLVTPIIDNNEIANIEEAINQPYNASIHLKTALQHLSNKQNPDYRNLIKESISAVEVILRIITGESTAGKALNKIQEKIHLPTVLKDGFEKIYAFTNGKDGIRHALMDETTLQLEDAKFMLVSCSAFVNYLRSKQVNGL